MPLPRKTGALHPLSFRIHPGGHVEPAARLDSASADIAHPPGKRFGLGESVTDLLRVHLELPRLSRP